MCRGVTAVVVSGGRAGEKRPVNLALTLWLKGGWLLRGGGLAAPGKPQGAVRYGDDRDECAVHPRGEQRTSRAGRRRK